MIAVRSLETGKEREFLPKFNPRHPGGYPNALHWSPDGGSILFRGVGLDYRQGLFRLEVETGAVTAVVPPAREPYLSHATLWSPRATHIYYAALRPKTSSHHILKRDLETGQETELVSGVEPKAPFGGLLALSPDGRSLVYPFPYPSPNSLQVVSTAGGQPRELLRVEEPEIFRGPLTWTPDGRYLIFAKGRTGREGIELWRIPSEGGEPEKLDLKIDQPTPDLRFHPDGRRVAFSTKKEVDEIWALENFLPELRTAR